MGRMQKAKGASFERSICQKLSLWCSGMTREDIFWRSAMSGGRATFKVRRGADPKRYMGQSGDISAIHPLGQPLLELFVVECKHHKSLRMEPMVWGGSMGDPKAVWTPTLIAAESTNRQPLVIAKQNNRDILMLTTQAGREVLLRGFAKRKHLPIYAAFVYYGVWVMPFRNLLMHGNYRKLVLENGLLLPR